MILPFSRWKRNVASAQKSVTSLEEELYQARLKLDRVRKHKIEEVERDLKLLREVLPSEWRQLKHGFLHGYQEIRFNTATGMWDLYWDSDRFGRMYVSGISAGIIIDMVKESGVFFK